MFDLVVGNAPVETLGDLNGDNQVDFENLFLLGTRYGTDDPEADIHVDGVVDEHDVLELVQRWNRE